MFNEVLRFEIEQNLSSHRVLCRGKKKKKVSEMCYLATWR